MGDVARLAGVSSQTVSRVSNGFAGVNEDTRQQVLAAMRELGYRPNSAARALKRGEFRTLGVITFSLSTLGQHPHAGGDRHVRRARGVRRHAAARRRAHAGRGERGVLAARGAGRGRRHRDHGGPSARRGDRVAAARRAGRGGRLGRRRPVHRRRHRPGGRRAGRRTASAGARPRDGVAPGRSRGLLRGAAPGQRVARHAHEAGVRAAPPLRARRLVGGVGLPGRAADSPNRRTVRRCSPRTTRWRSGCCGP